MRCDAMRSGLKYWHVKHVLYPILISSEHIPEDSNAHMTDEITSNMINNDQVEICTDDPQIISPTSKNTISLN
jgi:hypothetical protein